MKKMLQNFVSTICNILFVLWQDFVMFGRIHRAQSVTLLWLAYRIGVVEQCCQMLKYNTLFTKTVQFFMLVCMGVGRIFPWGPLVDFIKVFLLGAKSGEICFLPLETEKTTFFAEIFTFLPPFPHPCFMLVCRKRSCHTI